jgi:bifunctional DNase/RNase
MKVNSTYFSRIHLGRVNEQGEVWDEVDVDSRPSDAINLAVRFGAPMHISRQIAAFSTSYPKEGLSSASSSQS